MQEKNIKIVKPSGENEYKLLVSFELNNSQYIVVDSKEKDANLNTVVYISRVDGNELVNVVDENEWQSVRATLIAIVKQESGVVLKNIEQLEFNASENIGHPLALPEKHLSKIVESYSQIATNESMLQNVQEELNSTVETVETEVQTEEVENVNKLEDSIENAMTSEVGNEQPVVMEETVTPVVENSIVAEEPVMNIEAQPVAEDVVPQVIQPIVEEQPVVMEENGAPVVENPVVAEEPVVAVTEEPVMNIDAQPVVEDVVPQVIQPVVEEQPIVMEENVAPVVENPVVAEEPVVAVTEKTITTDNESIEDLLDAMKENFLQLERELTNWKEELIKKEQELNEKEQMLNQREQEINEKEQEINALEKQTSETYETAKAQLEVANIAFENSQRISAETPVEEEQFEDDIISSIPIIGASEGKTLSLQP